MLVCIPPPAAAPARAPDAAKVEYSEKKVRPLFVQHRRSCHGADAKKKGGLRLTARAELLAGGDCGPSLVPGDGAGRGWAAWRQVLFASGEFAYRD